MNRTHASDQYPLILGTRHILKELVAADLIATALIAMFGIAGNFLTMWVLRCPNLRQTSTGFYLTCLSAVDIIVLIIGPIARAVSAAVFASDRHLRDVHESSCKVALFVNYSASQISAWILVAVTVDRAVWVLRPFRARQVCTVRRAVLACTAIFLAVCGVNLQVLLLAKLVRRPAENATVCDFSDKLTRDVYVTYIDPALVTAGPFLVMLAANLLIVRRLRELRALREASLTRRGAPTSSTPASAAAGGSNLTRMLLCTNAFYLVSSLPYLLIMLVLKERRQEILRTRVLANLVYLVQVLCYLLFTLNYAMHFLLYCLVGPIFKAEAFRLLGIRQKERPAEHHLLADLQPLQPPQPPLVEKELEQQRQPRADQPSLVVQRDKLVTDL